ncbi:hypothetical protein L6R53_32815 [Myxococcota bacterium]|nr:hypothetical protein [Myxococcota bacterium]
MTLDRRPGCLVLTLGLLPVGCAGGKDHVNPRVGRFEFHDASHPPSEFQFPELLDAHMTAEACLESVTFYEGYQYFDTHDPVPLGLGFDITETSIDSSGRGAFSLSLDTDRAPVRLDCMTNASADFFCWSEERNADIYRMANPYAVPTDNLTDRPRPDARRPALAPVSQPPRSYYWHYIYGWILDPDDREVLFGVLLTATNHEGYWPCPDRTMWTAEWVGEAE